MAVSTALMPTIVCSSQCRRNRLGNCGPSGGPGTSRNSAIRFRFATTTAWAVIEQRVSEEARVTRGFLGKWVHRGCAALAVIDDDQDTPPATLKPLFLQPWPQFFYRACQADYRRC